MNFAIVAIIILLLLLFLFFVVLIIIGLTTDRERTGTNKPSVFSSLTSKVPSSKTILKIVSWIVIVVVIITSAISLWPKSGSRQEVYGSIEMDEFGAKWICEDVEFRNINMTTENFNYRFYVLGLGRQESVKIILTLEDELQKCEIPFFVRSSDEIAGTEVQIIAKDVVYIFVNGVDLIEEDRIPKKYFILDGQKYNATIRIETDRTCLYCQKIGPGNFERTELRRQGRIGLVKFKFQ